MASSRIARSRMQRARGPGWSSEWANGMVPSQLTWPKLGFMPATPQYEAGRVIEPPVCDPKAPRHMPQANAAAEPLLEPPGVRCKFQGLRVTGGSKQAKFVVTVL